MLNEENEDVKEIAKGYVQRIAEYRDFIDSYKDRGDINETKTEVTRAMLGLQEISKTEDFQENPKSYIGLKNIESFREVLEAQSDTNSPYYVSSASGYMNFYDHDKFIDQAVQVSEETLRLSRGAVTPGMVNLKSEIAERGASIKEQVLSSNKKPSMGR